MRIINFYDLCMPPGNGEADKRKTRYSLICIAGDKMCQDMCLQVVNLDNGNIGSKCKSFGKRCADKKRSEQARPTCKCNSIKLIFLYLCLFESLVNDRNNILLVSPGGKFRNYTAVVFMNFLSGNDIGKDFGILGNSC